MDDCKKIDIRILTKYQLREIFVKKGLLSYKADQVYNWIWKKGVHSFDLMTDVSKESRTFRRRAAAEASNVRALPARTTAAGAGRLQAPSNLVMRGARNLRIAAHTSPPSHNASLRTHSWMSHARPHCLGLHSFKRSSFNSRGGRPRTIT